MGCATELALMVGCQLSQSECAKCSARFLMTF